ncbi:hypothetical protein BD413DRAFT_548263 [Trametes elegans]|nr:hypothetical protein BD413DRAFT_548263 [Trametes elegans]
MLSTNALATPRPPPPAKTRKSSALHYSKLAPPPPYAPPLSETLLDSPIPITAQLVNAATLSPDGTGGDDAAPMDEWMNEKSREELSGLLLKADGLIKTRETELGYTSALCKSLYDDNVALKTKHEALLARLPGAGTSSPAPSTPTSPRPGTPGASRSPGIMFPSSFDEPLQPLPPSARLRHTRRISVTPGELAHLADQNAELLDKLEQLESESCKADLAGKRKLRKLEQEIQTLREELDKTQAKGAELEEQAKAAVSAVQMQRKKEEVRALKEKAAGALFGSDLSAAEVRDFAPPPELPRSTPRKRRPVSSEADHAPGDTSDALSDELSFDSGGTHEELDCETYFPSSPVSAHEHNRSGTEFAIVSQLLSKIRELEETNAQIKEQQRATEERMRAAQWDVDSIRRVYDCLDVADIDIEDEDSPLRAPRPSRVPSGGTIRFSSLRRTLIGDMSRLHTSEGSDGFASGISKGMQSTIREEPNGPRSGPGHKTRKSVVGLFDANPRASIENDSGPAHGDYPPSLKPAMDEVNMSGWSIAATDGLAPPSPSLSLLQAPLEGPHSGRTLGSELGSEFGDEWPERGFNHHLRASSLYELAGLNASQSTPCSPSESFAAPPSILFPSTEDTHPVGRAAGSSTPPPAPALQLNIEPPTPTPERLRSPAAARQHRLSQTVRARTNRWVEGRFPQDQSQDTHILRKRQSAVMLGGSLSFKDKLLGHEPTHSDSDAGEGRAGAAILDETFGDAVARVRRVQKRASLAAMVFTAPSPHELAEAALEASEAAIEDERAKAAERAEETRQLVHPAPAAVADPAQREGVVGLVLQAWLWLQFAVVVMLFLWAMAKRGPKVVLEAERRGRGAHRVAGHL